MPQFLNYFTYERIEKSNDNLVFLNVTFLTPVGKYQVGGTADAVSISIGFYIWEGKDLTEDIVVLV